MAFKNIIVSILFFENFLFAKGYMHQYTFFRISPEFQKHLPTIASKSVFWFESLNPAIILAGTNHPVPFLSVFRPSQRINSTYTSLEKFRQPNHIIFTVLKNPLQRWTIPIHFYSFATAPNTAILIFVNATKYETYRHPLCVRPH